MQDSNADVISGAWRFAKEGGPVEKVKGPLFGSWGGHKKLSGGGSTAFFSRGPNLEGVQGPLAPVVQAPLAVMISTTKLPRSCTRQSPELKQGRSHGESQGGKFHLRFSIRWAFCPCGLTLFQLRGPKHYMWRLFALSFSLPFIGFVSKDILEIDAVTRSKLRTTEDRPQEECEVSVKGFGPKYDTVFTLCWFFLKKMYLCNVND